MDGVIRRAPLFISTVGARVKRALGRVPANASILVPASARVWLTGRLFLSPALCQRMASLRVPPSGSWPPGGAGGRRVGGLPPGGWTRAGVVGGWLFPARCGGAARHRAVASASSRACHSGASVSVGEGGGVWGERVCAGLGGSSRGGGAMGGFGRRVGERCLHC